MYIYIQCVFFFIELKVFVNLTYLNLFIICQKNLDLDRGFLSKPVFLLYACRASSYELANGFKALDLDPIL